MRSPLATETRGRTALSVDGEWLRSQYETRAPEVLDPLAFWVPRLLALVAILTVAVMILRLMASRRARANRRTVALIPSSQFDPGAEDILRFSGTIHRVQHATKRITIPRRSRYTRVHLTSVGEGRMAQLLTVPASAETLIRKRGFDQVELGDPAKLLRSGGTPAVVHPSDDPTDDADAHPSDEAQPHPQENPAEPVPQAVPDSDPDDLDVAGELAAHLDAESETMTGSDGNWDHVPAVTASSPWSCLEDDPEEVWS